LDSVQRPPVGGPSDPNARLIRRTWLLFAISFALFAVVLVVSRIVDGVDAWDIVVGGLLALVGAAAGLYHMAVRDRERVQRDEITGFARILRGLSRSVSPDAIVGAIARELGDVAGADHVVVVRRPPDSTFVEATLVSMRPGVQDVTTVMTGAALDDETDWSALPDEAIHEDRRRIRSDEPVAIPIGSAPSHGGDVRLGPSRSGMPVATVTPGRTVGDPMRTMASVADRSAAPVGGPAGVGGARLGARVRSAFGLAQTISAPLRAEGRIVGAIVLSRRGREPWSASARRLLEAAAGEASAALSRAYSFRQAQAKATTDALTGLPNRAYFDELCELLSRRRQVGDSVGVLMVDLDHFKALNDRFGHHVGDEVLREVAGAIAGAVRDVDVPARYGGEEFVVLLRDPGRDVSIEVGERVRAAVAALDLRHLHIRSVSVSVGAAVQVSSDEPISAVVAAADKALYRAKRQGRDRVVAG
jgi:diguanylate cyclase (GGDEF)-like protein